MPKRQPCVDLVPKMGANRDMNGEIAPEAWPGIVRRVHAAMAEHVRPYLASISKTKDNKSGTAHGSGIYLAMRKGPSLGTCEHVVRQGHKDGHRIAHLPKARAFYCAFNNQWFVQPYPVDLALTLIDPAIWSGGDRMALSLNRIATTHDIAPHELLTLCGHPGQGSYFTSFTDEPELLSPLIPYTARETALPAEFDPAFHFALQYEMNLAEAADDSRRTLPAPPGFSGAPIWDTGFIGSKCSEDWTPARARVVGIASRWLENNSCIIGIKAEIVTAFLKELDALA
jgi:hypothetical protein